MPLPRVDCITKTHSVTMVHATTVNICGETQPTEEVTFDTMDSERWKANYDDDEEE